jgi:DNA segregation ATPase FtsK/SpoIIIE, S-DNA-T family
MTKQNKGKKSGDPKTAMPPFMVKRISEGGFILVLTLAIYTLLSLLTYGPTDPGLLHATNASEIKNAGGQVGAYISDALYLAFGYMAFLLPISFAYLSWVILKDHRAFKSVNKPVLLFRGVGLLLLLCGSTGLLSFDISPSLNIPVQQSGGVLGMFMVSYLNPALNQQGTSLLLLAFFLCGVTWLTGLSWVKLTEGIGRYTLYSIRLIGNTLIWCTYGFVSGLKRLKQARDERPIKAPNVTKPLVLKPKAETQLIKQTREPEKTDSTPKMSQAPKHIKVAEGLPALSLLSKGKPGKPMGGYTHQQLETLSRVVEQNLIDFGIQADVVSVHPGPVITRFELQLAAGVKVSKLSSLSKDLARSLSVTSVRVVEIIPGKTVVGLELPNQDRATVSLSEVLSADVYQNASSPLTLALGVDIAGHPMVVDLGKMPHLLVAGTTGSGKSVGINAMILSLLYKASPDQVRLIMVDPKMLELSVYDGIPHLLSPVVTDMKEAASALRWCVGEMERRYKLMASFGVRNLAGFNTKITEAKDKGETLTDPLWKSTSSMDESAPELQPLPYIVVVIDELADMMMVVGKKVEQLIARIAQKARAAGIHLILATQRPSVDVLTGLIKSNIPTRISFQVSSKIDSRTILDQQGADQLLGWGDMLFLSPGAGAPLRVHGAFVDDKEVHRVADDWRARGTPEYIDEITENAGEALEGMPGEEGQDTEDSDALYDQAVEFVLQTRKASISSVQRRFKIGYNRAARLVEEMERAGLVGPLEGGVRDVLVSSPEEG